jgi:hypothetical protein
MKSRCHVTLLEIQRLKMENSYDNMLRLSLSIVPLKNHPKFHLEVWTRIGSFNAYLGTTVITNSTSSPVLCLSGFAH